jgi:4-hydroxybenzoyl-CoA thioesterase
MSKPIETSGQAAPESSKDGSVTSQFIHSIRVRWGDCDPAAIAYTPNIPAWALEAIEAWWEHFAGVDWYQINLDRKIGTPFVHMSLDFRAPITPCYLLDCEVILKCRGTSSITHKVRGFQNGVLCFEGDFTAVFVDAKSMRPRTPPSDIMAAFEKIPIDPT